MSNDYILLKANRVEIRPCSPTTAPLELQLVRTRSALASSIRLSRRVGRALWRSGDMQRSVAGKAPFSSISGMLTKKTFGRVYNLIFVRRYLGVGTRRFLMCHVVPTTCWRDTWSRRPPGPSAASRDGGSTPLRAPRCLNAFKSLMIIKA